LNNTVSVYRRIVIEKFDAKRYRINEKIVSEKVRLVGDEGGPRVITMKEALEIAREKALDLVEISPNQDPPVVRMVDFSKFRFEQIKKAKDAKKKQKVVHVKEIKFRPAIDSNDYRHKVNHSIEFLQNGDKVKFTIMFRGREIMHNELGFKIMENIQKDLDGMVQIEKRPSIEGKNITMVVSPTPGGIHKPKKTEQG
jgi:translation initiation factor IF-3